MSPSIHRWFSSAVRHAAAVSICSCAMAMLVGQAAIASDTQRNLSADLRALAEEQGAARTARAAPDDVVIDNHALQVRDSHGRVRVKILLDGRSNMAEMRARVESLPGAVVSATDDQYNAGVIEAFVYEDQLVKVAKTSGVGSVVSSPQMVHDVGAATTQGIIQHRIDQLAPGINGAGITVGVLSDSFDTDSTIDIHAADDVASGDLPGAGNPNGNSKPVVVLEDFPDGTDEGRAMAQIVHDIAPKARLGFATADTGEVGFANNIRSLAGLRGAPNAVAGFKADVIVDDVIYLDEPFFQDGIVAQAVDDVARAGVSYFSSAGNRPGSQGYDSPVRLVAPNAAALTGTNLNFGNVPPQLYAGGFQNFAPPGSPQDIAQTINIAGTRGTIVFQWNEPFDPTPPALGAVLAQGSGETTVAAPTKDFTFNGTVGASVAITADADPASAHPIPDVTIALIDPDGNVIGTKDDTTNPEILVAKLPKTGAYTIEIGGFNGAVGGFTYKVQDAIVDQRVVSDYNLLLFRSNGTFLGAIAEDNLTTNRPIELASITGPRNFQLVIARANTPARNSGAGDRMRYVWFTSGQPQEYYDYNSPVTYGHNAARGSTSVGAYAFYPPFVPEAFTSPGPTTIYFDKKNRRLRHPEVRLKPDLSAMDGANTTFFFADASQDSDTLPNFFGTSAAAPHAAGIAALMLQASPRRLEPSTLRCLMQSTTFKHDLDPNESAGFAGRGLNWVVVSANADGNSISQFDPNVFTVAYYGPSSLTKITLKPATANPTETPTTGVIFDTRPVSGQNFILGSSQGVAATDVTATFNVPAAPPALVGQFKELTVAVRPGAMTVGNYFRFGVDRDEADAFGPNGAVGGNVADLLGQGVLLPSGAVAAGGMVFEATLADGKTFTGTVQNRIGRGYSVQDGFGFVNAEAAVRAARERRGHECEIDDDDDHQGHDD